MAALEGSKFSFRVNDPDIVRVLEAKQLSKEMSTYVNDAIRFYLDNAKNINEIKQMLVQLKDTISNGMVTTQGVATSVQEKQPEIDPMDQLLADNLDVFE